MGGFTDSRSPGNRTEVMANDAYELSGETEPDSMDDEEDEIQFNNLFVAATCAIYMYHEKYIWKAPSMPSKETGQMWVLNVLNGDPSRCLEAFRMPKEIFIDLLGELGSKYGLRGSRSTSIKEVLAMTLSVLGCNESNRTVCKRFQHSGETVSRYFNEGLMALARMSMDIISPSDFEPNIARDTKYMPYFKDCIGIIDSTHVKARVPVNDQVAHTGKKEPPKQKVLAVCDFNMCFTFVVAGWEGSTEDGTILNQVISDPAHNFPAPLKGKYYLVNCRCPMRRGFLQPYRENDRLPDFWPFCEFSHDYQRVFNQRHSSLHSVIKRAFGIWKKKWIVLQDMPFFSFEKQRLIVAATMALHNYIRRHHSRSDPDFREYDENPEFVPSETQKYHVAEDPISQPGEYNGQDEYDYSDEDELDFEGENDDTTMSMAQLRDRIAHELATGAVSI
ncbi:uncharacterized protein LOC110103944 isoform X1 [Dendrobium catenatum]|uniref:Uncharacterized protein n=2 Tax=Dendrobium catenatum TaxID=906689 RepID=A0A2I0VEG8_9ASPA|nr:uncharacterized protein LOC110103944 isoform X1 [Dendrobium catenatum]PKU61791.1 hypothetical protein MA16_Dca023569 [Dendrobium catenatum]